MRSETSLYLDKARRALAEGEKILTTGLYDAAGRAAYFAAFHAAQALVFEHTGPVTKTHNGVRTEFQRLTKEDSRLDPTLRRFLSEAYNLKSLADYEIEPGLVVSPERAVAALKRAHEFVAYFASTIEADE